MTRILTFDGDRAPSRFDLLRTALLSAGDGKGERTAAVIRKEARLLDLLDGISDPKPGTLDDRMLSNHGPKQIELSQADFHLLQEYVEKTPWTPRASRQAVDLLDWLSSADKHDG